MNEKQALLTYRSSIARKLSDLVPVLYYQNTDRVWEWLESREKNDLDYLWAHIKAKDSDILEEEIRKAIK